jgi:hypothetical protein
MPAPHILTDAERALAREKKRNRSFERHYTEEAQHRAQADLKKQIALAKAEASRVPLYRGGWPDDVRLCPRCRAVFATR